MYEEEQKIYQERQMERYQILKEVYDFYFKSNGKGKQVPLQTLETGQTLVYKYLQDLGFVDFKPIVNMDGSANEYTITARGINFIEDGRGRRRGDFREYDTHPGNE